MSYLKFRVFVFCDRNWQDVTLHKATAPRIFPNPFLDQNLNIVSMRASVSILGPGHLFLKYPPLGCLAPSGVLAVSAISLTCVCMCVCKCVCVWNMTLETSNQDHIKKYKEMKEIRHIFLNLGPSRLTANKVTPGKQSNTLKKEGKSVDPQFWCLN